MSLKTNGIPTSAEIWMYGKITVSIQMDEMSPNTGSYTFTNSDIAEGGLVWSRSCASGEKIAFGEVIASEFDLTLINPKTTGNARKYDSYHFEGARLIPTLTATYPGQTPLTLQLGVFWVDNIPVSSARLTLVAYDQMVKLDNEISNATLKTFKNTELKNVISALNLNIDTPLTFPNATTKKFSYDTSDDGVTSTTREILRECCQLMGCIAYTTGGDISTQIKLKRFVPTVRHTLIPEQITSATVQAVPVDVEGVKITFPDDKTAQSGNTDAKYLLDVDTSFFYTQNGTSLDEPVLKDVTDAIFNGYMTDGQSTFSYMPCTINTFCTPFVDIADYIAFEVDGKTYHTYVTGVDYVLGGGTTITSIGTSNVAEGWSSKNKLTGREEEAMKKAIAGLQNIIKNFYTKTEVDEKDAATLESAVDDAVEEANAYTDTQKTTVENYANAIANLSLFANQGLGFYKTTDTDATTGAVTVYYHNNPTLAESTVVWMQNTLGMYWTNDYQSIVSGSGTWKNGFTYEGTGILANLDAWNIRADNITTGILRSANNNVVFNLQTGDFKVLSGELHMTSGEINIGKDELQTHITSDLAQLGNPLKLVRHYKSNGKDVYAPASVLQLFWGLYGTSESSLGVGIDPNLKTIVIGGTGSSYSDLIVNIANGGTTKTNNLVASGTTSLQNGLSVDGTVNLKSGNTDKPVLSYDSTNQRFNVGNVNTKLNIQTSGNLAGNLSINGYPVADFVERVETSEVDVALPWDTAQGVHDNVFFVDGKPYMKATWNTRIWHSRHAEASCSITVPEWLVDTPDGESFVSGVEINAPKYPVPNPAFMEPRIGVDSLGAYTGIELSDYNTSTGKIYTYQSAYQVTHKEQTTYAQYRSKTIGGFVTVPLPQITKTKTDGTEYKTNIFQSVQVGFCTMLNEGSGTGTRTLRINRINQVNTALLLSSNTRSNVANLSLGLSVTGVSKNL